MELSTLSVSKSEEIISRLMAHDDHLSFSSLVCFKEAPSKFIDYKLGKKEQTDAMLYGSMVHCLILEPDAFEERYFTIDDREVCEQIGGAKPRATIKYKDWYACEQAKAGTREVVETNDFLNAQIVASNVLHNRASRKILDLCPEREQGVQWEYKNFKFRGKIDARGEAKGRKRKFDLKTCADAEPKKFHRELIYNSYYLQGAMYEVADPGDEYYIIAVDKTGGVSVHLIDDHLMKAGLEEYEKLVDAFNTCVLKEQWDQSFDFWAERWDGIFSAEKPGWMY